MAGKHVVIVPGYGVNPTPELQKYCKNVRSFVENHYVDLLIPSGGESSHCTKPGLTEARVMWELINGEKGLRHTPHVIFEEESLTSIGNIENSSKKMREWLSANHERIDSVMITIFSEWYRFKKMVAFADHFLPECKTNTQFCTIQWERGFKPAIKQIISTKIETEALRRPWLREWVEARARHNAHWR